MSEIGEQMIAEMKRDKELRELIRRNGYSQGVFDALDVINAHPELDPNHTLRSKILNLKIK